MRKPAMPRPSERGSSARSSTSALAKKVVRKESVKPPERKAGPASKAPVRSTPSRAAESAGRRVVAPVRGEPGPGVSEFEAAIKLIHRQDWRGAGARLREILERFPTEIDLNDRVHSYLRIVERQLLVNRFEPRTADEHYQLGVLKLNAGALDDAIQQLEKSVALEARSDKASYALGAALAQRGDRALAIRNLRRAVELNPDNRVFASNDSDLELLRDDPEFVELVGTHGRPSGSGGDESE